jgi:hypothetical protein
MPARLQTACGCDFLPKCHMVPTEIRDRRRYRHLLVRQMVQMKNRIRACCWKRAWATTKKRLHKVKYFRELLESNQEVEEILDTEWSSVGIKRYFGLAPARERLAPPNRSVSAK